MATNEGRRTEEQFPAVAGDEHLETEKRSQDSHGEALEDGRFRKVFVVLARDLPADDSPEGVELHERNKLSVLEQAIQQGLHPDEEADFEGREDHPDGESVCLRYSVAVTPSSVDHDPNAAVTPHHVLTERLDGSTDDAAAKKGGGEVTRSTRKTGKDTKK